MQNFDASPTLQFRVLQYRSSQGANLILGTKILGMSHLVPDTTILEMLNNAEI